MNNKNSTTFEWYHFALFGLIVVLFGLRYTAQLDISDWIWFGLALAVLGGALLSFLARYSELASSFGGGTEEEYHIPNPPLFRFLTQDLRSAPMWAVVRFYTGLMWLEAGLHKVTDEAWRDGSAILGFWERIVVVPEEGRASITYDWWRDFIQFLIDTESHTWFGPMIAWGEVAVGFALILGAFTGIAAVGGFTMNMAFGLSGSASSNPVLAFLAAVIILGWRVAGYWGADRVLLPWIGTPWNPGRLFRRGQRRQE